MRQLRNILVLAALLLVGCQKEDGLRGLPEGAIRLTAEGFHGGEKTSVSGTSVQWDGNSSETVTINGNDYEVLISGNKAYIDPGSNVISTPVRGYYACGSVVTPDNSHPDAVTVEIPDSYDCSMSGGRQVIALPLAAYSSSSNTTVAFKHLTAAVDVLVWNATGENLCVDRVVVTVAGHRLHGSLDLDLAAENFGMAGSYDDPVSEADSSVSVTFPSSGEGSLVIEPGEENAKSIQVPILPVDNDHDITVQIYTHVSDARWHKYIFEHHASIPNALTRNKMLTAKCKIYTAAGNHVIENKISVNSSQQVFFSPGNLQYIGSAASPYWQFAEHQYDAFFLSTNQERTTTNIDRDLFAWGSWNNPSISDKNNYHHSWTYDWGHNPISNGGNIADLWRTLSGNAWDTVLNIRTTSTSNLPNSIANTRYTMSTVGTHKGMIVFPDTYSHPKGTDFTAGTYNSYSNYTARVSLDGWELMEAAGAIFLPTTGYRAIASNNTIDVYRENNGYYWSRTPDGEPNAFSSTFSSNSVNPTTSTPRHQGLAVRLVTDAE